MNARLYFALWPDDGIRLQLARYRIQLARDGNGHAVFPVTLHMTLAFLGDVDSTLIPVIEKIAAENDKIETRYILRDENLDLMDQFLTKRARAIPKLIVLDADTLDVLATWGSRPAPAQELFYSLKNGGVEKAEISEKLQRWYNEDRGRTIQAEFVELMGRVESGSMATV